MSSSENISYEIIQLRPNQVLVYTYYPDKGTRSKKKQGLFFQQTEQNQKYTGILTAAARKKLRYAINLLVAQSEWKEALNFELDKTFKFRINFLTLTLSAPQGNISDKEIKRVCLNNFLNRAKKKWSMDTYVWRAEKQKNTNIHFHITTDVYIHYKELCEVWNECQELLGFVTRYRERTGGYQPNSTDVHSVKDVKSLANYLVKYMSKKEKDAQLVEGKVWGCSRNLLKAQKYEIEAYGKHYEAVKTLFDTFPEQVFENDHCSILSLPESTFKKAIAPYWGVEYKNYLGSVKNPALISQVPVAPCSDLPLNKSYTSKPKVVQLDAFAMRI